MRKNLSSFVELFIGLSMRIAFVKKAKSLLGLHTLCKIVLVLIASVVIISCTREAEKVSSVSFQVPTKTKLEDKASLAIRKSEIQNSSTIPGYANLTHVIVNVSGPGMPGKILCHFDIEHEEMAGPCGFAEFPKLSVGVPTGNDRLIQLGLAFSDPVTGMLVFKYGDAIQNLAPGDQQVSITVNTLGAGGEQGHLAGRYLTGANEGPTGQLEVKIKPDNGRPALTLVNTEIFSGWFSTFSMSGIEFEYVVNGSQLLWGQGINKAFLQALASAGAPVKISSGGDGYESYGFFGETSFTTGKNASASSCSSGEFETCIGTNTKFSGPFKATSNGLLNVTSTTLSWDLLPGVSEVLTGFRLLYNPTVDVGNNVQFAKFFSYGDRQFNCNFLENYQGTQILASSIPIGQTSYSHGLTSFPATALMALCPRKNDIAFRSAIVYPDTEQGGGNDSPYLRLDISVAGGGQVPTLTHNICYPASFALYQSGGQNSASPFSPTAVVTIANAMNPTTGSPWLSLYSDTSCTTAASTTLNFAIGQSSVSGLYVKPTVLGAALSVSPTITSSEGIEYRPEYNQFNVSPPSIQIFGPSAFIVGDPTMCYAVQVARVDGAGFPINGDSSSVSLTHNGGSSGINFYGTHADCLSNSNPNGSFSISSFNSNQTIFMKRPSGTSAATLTFSASGFTTGTFVVTGSNNSVLASKFILTPMGPQEIGRCNMVRIRSVNSAGDEVPVMNGPNVVTLSTNSPNVMLSQDGNCQTSIVNNEINFNQGDSRRDIFYRSTSNTSVIINAAGGVQKGSTESFSLVAPTDVEMPYLTFNLPQINSIALGTHDFPKAIPLTVTSGATVTCEKSTDPTHSSWSPCSGAQFDTSTKTVNWLGADAVGTSGIGFRLTVSKGFRMTQYHFIPRDQYSQNANKPFQVYTCDVVLSGDSILDINEINTAVGSNSVVCLAAGTFSDGTALISLSSGKQILGATTATGASATTFQTHTGNNFSISGTAGLSNISFVPQTSASGNAIVVLGSGTGEFTSSNNLYSTNQYHQYGVKRTGTIAFKSYSDKFNVDGSVSASYGYYVYCTSYVCGGPSDLLYRPAFGLLSTPTGQFARGVGFYQSNNILDVINAKLDNTNRDGTIISVDDSGTAQTKTINLKNSNLSFSSPNNNLNRFPIFISGKGDINITNSSLTVDMPQNLIKSSGLSTNSVILNIQDSKLISRIDQAAIFFGGGSSQQTLITNRVHFVRLGNSGNSMTAVNSASGAHLWNTNSASSPKDTRFCGTDSGTTWSSYSSFTPAGGSTMTAESVTSMANATDEACQ